MLSENIQSLHDRLHEYLDTGMQLEPKGVEMICAILAAAVEDAQELENRTVPDNERICDLPDNVVRIANVLARKGVHVCPRSCDEGPGGAA